MTIKTEIKKTKENNVELTVEVAAEQFKQSVSDAYRKISGKAKIPGFRTGKIPAKIIDSHFGKGYVMQQALEDSLPTYYSQAVHEVGIRPITSPNIEIVSVDEAKPLKFKAKVEVEPEVELPTYNQLKADFKKEKVKDEDIQAQLDIIRNRFAELNPAPSKVADTADYLLINFDGTINGKPFEGGSAQNFLLEIGSNTLIAEFEKQLIGSKAGDIKNITVTMPPGLENKELSGKTAVFKVLVKEVKVKKLPQLDDKFVKEITGLENLEALKKSIKNDLQKSLDKQAQTQYKHALLQQLAEKSKVNIPQRMVDITLDEMLKEFEQSLKQQGSNLEHYFKTTKTDEKKLKENLTKSAEQRTRQELAFKAFIDKEKVQVTDEEIDKAINELSTDKQKPLGRKELEQKGLMGYLKSNIIYKKALDLLAKKTEGDKQK